MAVDMNSDKMTTGLFLMSYWSKIPGENYVDSSSL